MRSPILTSLLLVAMNCIGFSALGGDNSRIDPDRAWRDTRNMSELIDILEGWLDVNTDFRRADELPAIRLISPSTAVSLGGNKNRNSGRLRGLFDPQGPTIYLIQPWNPKAAQDVSVLLHELVHSRQMSKHYYCPGEQEEAAYRLQDEWLRERGLKANVNWIEVVLEAGCTPRDIHPD